ncbi:MAG: polysaccharide biosynthesis tyrosine autokinase [Stigonema ocellatum SAG 48.90 = DSM 106950]|nr:polysaccharide biosynthesis tyrosine autokinase [Stigonema ocellatum SAG 48.90 = DSM 106950]
MQNNSSPPPSSNRNSNSVAPFTPPQTFPWSEKQGDDWNFQEFLGIVQRRRLVIAVVATVVMAAAVVLTRNNKPQYESSFQLLVEPVNNEKSALDLFKDPSSTQSSLDYDSQIQVLKSPEQMGITVQHLQATYPDITYGSLISSLSITEVAQTKILEVRYRSNDPLKVKVVLDTIAKDFLNYSVQQRQTKLRQGIKFVEKQLPSMQKRVDTLQQEVQVFRQKYDFINPESQGTQVTEQITALSGQRQQINQQLAQARANFASLQGKEGELAALNNAVVYQQLIVQLRQLDSQIALESTRYQDDNPSLQALKAKREKLLPLLREEEKRFLDVKFAEVATALHTLEVQSQELAKVEQKLEQRRKQLPILLRQYTELQRTLQVTNDSLNRFLANRETLQIQAAQVELNWQLIKAPTQPDGPVDSGKSRTLLLGLVGGVLSGVGIALLIEKLDKTYHTAHALKEKMELPLIGNIPFEKQIQGGPKQQTLIVRTPDSLNDAIPGLAVIPAQDYSTYSAKFLEAFRLLYTNIQLLSSDRPIRSIIISSAMARDGKSTVAFHLAQIATAMGQRVLLVDADLRQPIIHSLSNLNNSWGLSSLITTNLPVEEVIRQLPSMNQLSVITAGPIPPDSTKLLSSQKMKRLMENFHNTFDLVIYDAPPLVGLADASLLAPHTDGIVFVVKIDKTDSSMVKRALDSLKMSRVNVLGLVANGQKSNFDGY